MVSKWSQNRCGVLTNFAGGGSEVRRGSTGSVVSQWIRNGCGVLTYFAWADWRCDGVVRGSTGSVVREWVQWGGSEVDGVRC